MTLRLEIIFSKEKRSISFKSLQVLLRSDLFKVSRLLLHGMAKFTIQRGFFSVWELLSGTNYRRVHCVLLPKTARQKPRFTAPKGHIVFCCLLWKKRTPLFSSLKKACVSLFHYNNLLHIYSEYFFSVSIYFCLEEKKKENCSNFRQNEAQKNISTKNWRIAIITSAIESSGVESPNSREWDFE